VTFPGGLPATEAAANTWGLAYCFVCNVLMFMGMILKSTFCDTWGCKTAFVAVTPSFLSCFGFFLWSLNFGYATKTLLQISGAIQNRAWAKGSDEIYWLFWESPEEGRGVVFPQQIAILADCATIIGQRHFLLSLTLVLLTWITTAKPFLSFSDLQIWTSRVDE